MRTSEDRKRLHLLMWGIIAETGCDKLSARKKLEVTDFPINNCFACEEAGVVPRDATWDDCRKCPVIWDVRNPHIGSNVICNFRGSPYRDFTNGYTKEAAKAILALPFKGAWAEPTVTVGLYTEQECTVNALHKTILDVKVGDTVWFRDGSQVTVTSVGNSGFQVETGTDCWVVHNVLYNGRINHYPMFGQVVFATCQDVLDAEKEKKPKILYKEVIRDLQWFRLVGLYVPSAIGGDFKRFLNKPPMTMTLEWEENGVEKEVSDV
jgi:hypothetical protein